MDKLINADELLLNLSDDLPYKSSVKRTLIQAPAVDAVPIGAYNQVVWERDMAMKQLESYGVQFGEKADMAPIVRCNRCIHRKELTAMEIFHYGANVVWCSMPRFVGILMGKDNFCSYGEYKDGD